jgi:hypothetical protein
VLGSAPRASAASLAVSCAEPLEEEGENHAYFTEQKRVRAVTHRHRRRQRVLRGERFRGQQRRERGARAALYGARCSARHDWLQYGRGLSSCRVHAVHPPIVLGNVSSNASDQEMHRRLQLSVWHARLRRRRMDLPGKLRRRSRRRIATHRLALRQELRDGTFTVGEPHVTELGVRGAQGVEERDV